MQAQGRYLNKRILNDFNKYEREILDCHKNRNDSVQFCKNEIRLPSNSTTVYPYVQLQRKRQLNLKLETSELPVWRKKTKNTQSTASITPFPLLT